MKNALPFAVIVTAFLFSCQKEKSVDLPSNTVNKVKTYTEEITSPGLGNSITTYNLEYDNNDRVISFISTPSPDFKFLLTYNTSSSYSLDIYNASVLDIHEDFFYTSNSYLDSTFQYNSTKDSSTEKYLYNANNQLIKSREYNYSKITGAVLTNTISYTYDADGNMIESTDTDLNNDQYEYYPDLVYAYPIIGIADAVSSKKHHLIKTHSATSNGYPLGSVTLTYTFDSNDRISIEKQVASDGSIVLKTYTYF